MLWTAEEEKLTISILEEHPNWMFSQVSDELSKRGISRTTKSISHKNMREWRVTRVYNHVPHVDVGEKNPNWKGGRTRSTKGYILIYSPNHPRSSNGYVSEHTLVMEKRLGRYLKCGECVHHINGVKDDNRDDNLELFTSNWDHIRKRYPMNKPKREGWTLCRRTKHNLLSLPQDIIIRIPEEFYARIMDNRLVIDLKL